MLGQHRRRWTNIELTVGDVLYLQGLSSGVFLFQPRDLDYIFICNK